MPKLHSSLMMGAGCPPLNEIPTVATWHGLIAQAMRHMANEKRKFNRPHLWADLGDRPPVMRPSQTHVSRFLGVEKKAIPVEEARLPPSRVAGDLTTTQLVTDALARYHTGILSAGPPNDEVSKSIHGLLLSDIYAITGKCMKVITRNPSLRTDNDCACFPLYRSLHWEAAVQFGRVFTIEPDQIDSYLRRQNITMSDHGASVDNYVGGIKYNGVSRLVYLSDENALAVRLEIEGGKFLISDGDGAMINFDCSGPTYRDISKEFKLDRRGRPQVKPDRYGNWRRVRQNTRTHNPARRGTEWNEGLGVAGFAMATNRDIFAKKHQNYDMAEGSFYHSSYLNGREVISTGCITVVAGELKYINNWSGHYQPKPRQIYLVLRAFQTLGVDLTNVMVECQRKGRSTIRLLAPEFMSRIDKGGTFDEQNDRYYATAENIKQVLTAYEERAGNWWSRPSAGSLRAMNELKAISDPESLVKQTSLLLRSGRLGKTLRSRLEKVMQGTPWQR